MGALDPALDQVLALCTAEDAIFDPAIDEHLQKYLDKGGSLETACTTLSNSYNGYYDAIAELYDWAQLSESGEKVLHEALEHVVKQHESSLLPSINTQLSKDPDSASTIKSLTSSPRWSAFMADMAGRHKQTAFYDIVTREAKLPEIGISSDVLRTPEAFIAEIMDQFENVLGSETPISNAELLNFLKRISIMCTYDELTTVVSLRLFAELSRDAEEPYMRALYRRVLQEIRNEAMEVMTTSSTVPKPIARQYVIRLAISTDCALSKVTIKKPVIDALLTIADCGYRRRFDKEISILMGEYGLLLGDDDMTDPELSITPMVKPTSAEQKVRIQALCHVEVFLDLVKALYSHSCRTYLDGRPDAKKRRCLSLLLSYVSVFIRLDDREIEERLSNETSKEVLRESVKEMYDKLNSTAEICEELLPGSPRAKIKGNPVEVLLNSAEYPLIARGIVVWAKECLHGGTDLRSLLMTTPKHLGFLEAVAKLHDDLCEDILLVIHTAFTRDYPGLDLRQVNRLRDMFMRTISGMLRFGMGPQVVLTFQRLWVDSAIAKKPHLRNFVAVLFQTISPPYSASFAAAVNEFLGHDRVLSAIEGDVALSGKVFNFRDETAGVLSKQNGITES